MKSPPRPEDETPVEATPARLRLYNTLTRGKEDFAPIDPKAVRLYVCGPTVYDFAHIGNARPVIVFDVLFRLLRHVYGASHVTYVRNITDVEDKINARAAQDYPDLPLNEAIAKVTEATERQFHEDVAALGALPPTHEPRATQYIDTMRAMIERLIARGVAYVAEDHVLFSPSAMDALPWTPRYGTLANRSLDEMFAGARVDVAPYKRDPMDFVLWKPSKPNEPGWPSPAGIATPGRPGWHIECSAMSMATLLEPFGGGLSCDDPSRNIFDIHGGGIDLVFPHHENEIAQSCCAFHSSRMANIWMHNGFLQVEGEKMSKSLGNFVTIHELLRNYPGDALRLNMIQTHYRQPIDWRRDGVISAMAELRRWSESIVDWFDFRTDFHTRGSPDEGVVDALCDDLNTPMALTRLRDSYRRARGGGSDERASFAASAQLLGFRHLSKPGYFDLGFSGNFFESGPQIQHGSEDEKRMLQLRAATANGMLSLVDDLRRQIDRDGFRATFNNAGVMTVGNNTGGDIDAEETKFKAKVEKLIAERAQARAARNWAESDRLRDDLAALGVAIKDNKDGTTSWEPKR
ncbi:MAG TPA: cysteine--tRNA ligase [Roseiarcus sp.]|jgi:cysteinyl-tRNA synthetase|nr:cysteine--tRNA ligase [Roseiarcus sp.]